MTNRRLVALFLAVLTAPTLSAQEIRGIVRDSATNIGVRGAVVQALDSAGTPVARQVTGNQGQYRLALAAGARSIQVVRLGFRPSATLRIPAAAGGSTQLDVTLISIPTLLENVKVLSGATCPRRRDAAITASLVDQARAGLLATIVVRESNPAMVTRLAYDRTMDGNGDKIVRQRVRLESADRATVSFDATHAAIDFAIRGFMSDSGGRQRYFGPDADVLLDENFGRAYCFSIADADPARPNQVGLAFAPAGRRSGRVDITGALWVDTAAKTLKTIEFRYVGLSALAEGLRSGGQLSFREMSSGIVLIDRWSLRLVGAADTAISDAGGPVTTRRGYQIRDVGGELVSALWDDGRAFKTPLGGLAVDAVNHLGKVAAGAVLGLENTDYFTTVDANGRATFTNLLPGPYRVVVRDPRLAAVGISIPTALTFQAARDVVGSQRLEVPTAEDLVASACREFDKTSGSAWVTGRVMTADGYPVNGARWRINRAVGGGWIPVADKGITGSSGTFHFCSTLSLGETVEIQAWREGRPRESVVRRLIEKLTVAKITLPTAVVARGRDAASRRPPVTLAGTVTDTATGTPIAGALIALLGTPFEAVADSAGRFTIPKVVRGEYNLEVRTPSLDSLGAVNHSILVVNDSTVAKPLQLRVPDGAQIARAMCTSARAAETNFADGVIVGRIGMPGDSTLPPNVRVVAEWAETPTQPSAKNRAPKIRWTRTRTDKSGAFRLCGLPLNTTFVLRTEVDSGTNAAAAPRTVTMAANQTFARADLLMEPNVDRGAVFTGTVVTDKTEIPVGDVAIELSDVSKTVLTNADGSFRISGVPAGTHKVTVRRLGFAPVEAQVNFAANQTLDHKIPLEGIQSIKAVEVNTSNAPASFEENRKLGLGKFFTRDNLAKNEGRRLGDIMAITPGLGMVQMGGTGHAWVVGKRVPPKIPPGALASSAGGGRGASSSTGGRSECGGDPVTNAIRAKQGQSSVATCTMDKQMIVDQGTYCPESQAEQMQGISCNCYAVVYLDGRVLNTGSPTPPFDLNTVATNTLEGIEWYASAGQTPGQYARLNSNCGVLILHTRRSVGQQ